MRKTFRFTAVILTAVILLLSLPVHPAQAAQTAVVKGGWLILRASPSFSGTILSSYPTGTRVTVNGHTGSWYAVTAPDGLQGYMLGDYLQISGSGSGGSIPSGTAAYVTSANGLNVRLRSGPGKGYSILASYAPGTPCTILTAGNNWSRIQIGSYTGYMMSRYLTTRSIDPVTPVPQPVPHDQYVVYVTSSNGKGVNLRSGPSKAFSSIGFYSVGTEAMMLTRGSTWSYIRVGSRAGYMMTRFLTTQEPQPPAPILGAAYVVSANGRNVNLRVGPSTGYQVISSYPVGTRLNIITRGRDWYFIQINGQYGYMMKQFIYDNASPATRTDL